MVAPLWGQNLLDNDVAAVSKSRTAELVTGV